MKLKKLIISAAVLMLPLESIAEESTLVEGSSYRLEKTITVEPVSSGFSDEGCDLPSSKPAYAGKASKFEVIEKGDKCDVIRFWSVFKNSSTEDDLLVSEDVEYVLPSKIDGVTVEASTSRNGKTSGLLVVPYKYRTDDGSVTGEATVGYYAGWETRAGTYLVSAGLSQVNLPISDTETENQSAVTLAVGILLNNWNNIDMGLVVGVDHIGGNKGDSWKYEDDPWVSLMIGWNFSQ